MIVKLAAICVVLAVCFALPVEDPNVFEAAPTDSPLDPKPVKDEDLPKPPKPVKDEDLPKPPTPDDSDLKTEASAWWPYGLFYPRVYYNVPVRYSVWKSYF